MNNINTDLQCGYCSIECNASKWDNRSILVISRNHNLPNQIMHDLNTMRLLHSTDGYEEDLDGYAGFTAYTNIPPLQIGKLLDPEIIESEFITFCQHWGLIIEIKGEYSHLEGCDCGKCEHICDFSFYCMQTYCQEE